MKIENPTVEQLNEMLSKINWKVGGRYPNRYILDHEMKRTDYRVTDDRIEINHRDSSYNTSFYFKECVLELLESKDAVSISPIIAPNSAFVLFMNHTIPEKKIITLS